jgi:hypothetical protein
MKNILAWLSHPPSNGPKSTMYLRVMAGGVFLWEGILKFVYANQELAASPNWACRFRSSALTLSPARRPEGEC